MISYTNDIPNKNMIDRNGNEIHVNSHVLIKRMSRFIPGRVCGFTNNHKYVYVIAWDPYTYCESLFKRIPTGILVVNKLNEWK